MAYGFRASEADVCSRPRPPKPLPQQRALRGVDARQVAPLPVRVHISPHKLTRLLFFLDLGLPALGLTARFRLSLPLPVFLFNSCNGLQAFLFELQVMTAEGHGK